jgi:hypothetical protein
MAEGEPSVRVERRHQAQRPGMTDDIEGVRPYQRLPAREAGPTHPRGEELIDRGAHLRGRHLIARGGRDITIIALEITPVRQDKRD